MLPYYSVYFISYINIGHVISEKVVGYIVSNCVDFLIEFISFNVNVTIKKSLKRFSLDVSWNSLL